MTESPHYEALIPSRCQKVLTSMGFITRTYPSRTFLWSSGHQERKQPREEDRRHLSRLSFGIKNSAMIRALLLHSGEICLQSGHGTLQATIARCSVSGALIRSELEGAAQFILKLRHPLYCNICSLQLAKRGLPLAQTLTLHL
jgi:hypothetical protein